MASTILIQTLLLVGGETVNSELLACVTMAWRDKYPSLWSVLNGQVMYTTLSYLSLSLVISN